MRDLKDFSRDAMSQHVGGKANYKGITFQVFASAVQLARFALAACDGQVDDVFFQAENPESKVDDLHVVSPAGARWHFQMKAVSEPRWTSKLIEQFVDEAREYPQAILTLVFYAGAYGAALMDARNDVGLDFVRLDWVEFDDSDLGHQSKQVRQLIDALSPVANDEESYFATWRNLVGTWLLMSKGQLFDLMKMVALGSRYMIRQLQHPSEESLDQLKLMGSGMCDLKVEVSKGMLVISDGVIFTIVPIEESAEDTPAWWLEAPTNAWEMYRALGAIRDE